MQYELTKLSAPGWEQTFDSVQEAYAELSKHICKMCYDEFIEQYGHPVEDIYDLLWTSCGAEFMFEERR